MGVYVCLCDNTIDLFFVTLCEQIAHVNTIFEFKYEKSKEEIWVFPGYTKFNTFHYAIHSCRITDVNDSNELLKN